VHLKPHIALTPEISHQKHVVPESFNYNEALMDSCGWNWGELINLRLEEAGSRQSFRGSRIHRMILSGMMNENVNISTQIGWIYSVNSNDIKEINSMNTVRC
jgi:hypothetical protein